MEAMTMTFEQFQATRQWSDDLAETTTDASVEGVKGYAYGEHAEAYIEELGDDASAEAKAQGRWYLHIYNQEWISDDLEGLERRLYGYAESEGLI